jgi:hypothetical protein
MVPLFFGFCDVTVGEREGQNSLLINVYKLEEKFGSSLSLPNYGILRSLDSRSWL